MIFLNIDMMIIAVGKRLLMYFFLISFKFSTSDAMLYADADADVDLC
jgi:hypothetical protein